MREEIWPVSAIRSLLRRRPYTLRLRLGVIFESADFRTGWRQLRKAVCREIMTTLSTLAILKNKYPSCREEENDEWY